MSCNLLFGYQNLNYCLVWLPEFDPRSSDFVVLIKKIVFSLVLAIFRDEQESKGSSIVDGEPFRKKSRKRSKSSSSSSHSE